MTDNISRKAAIEVSPCTAVDPNITEYDRGYFDATIAYQKALTALPAVDGWLDIETFTEPTSLSSGCGVIIACHDGDVGEAYYRNFGDDSDGWWWSNTSWGDYPEPDKPTPVKWQPLPNPPEGIDQ